MKRQNKKKFNLLFAVLLIGYIPLFTSNFILSLFATSQLRTNLTSNTYTRLKACATSVEQYFTWDIREDILCKDDVSYEFIDSLVDESIQQTFFVEDTRYLTSIRDANGNRMEDTKADPAIWETVKAGNDFKDKNVTIAGTEYYVYYKPVKAEDGTVIGMAFAGEPMAHVDNACNKLMIKIYTIDTVLLLIFGVILFVVARMIRRPTADIADKLSVIADGDLTVDVDTSAKLAENALLIDATKSLQSKFNDIIHDVKTDMGDVNTVSKLINMATETCRSSSEDMLRAATELADGATATADSVQNVAKRLEMISESTDDIESSSKDTLELTSEMVSNSMSAKDKLNELISANKTSVQSANAIVGSINNVDAAVREITEAAELIANIASQTNLLSLNASIEAAHAGDAGKGFAVVASEIKALAEQSDSSAKQIKIVIDNITAKTRECVAKANEIGEAMNVEEMALSNVNETFESINTSISYVENAINQITEKTTTLKESKNIIVDEVDNLSGISQETAASTEETMASIETLKENLEDVSSRQSELCSIADKLKESVNLFKV